MVYGQPFFPEEVQDILRLSSTGHWDVAVRTPDGPLHVLAMHATPPVFDGPEDRNGLRNHDELRFWEKYLNGALAFETPEAPVVLLGHFNMDPVDGDGIRQGITDLLDHPRLQDPQPVSNIGTAKAEAQDGANARHRGDPGLDTADWRDDPGPGNLRVNYVLPDTRLTVLDAGLYWAPQGENGLPAHALVWVDVETGG